MIEKKQHKLGVLLHQGDMLLENVTKCEKNDKKAMQ